MPTSPFAVFLFNVAVAVTLVLNPTSAAAWIIWFAVLHCLILHFAHIHNSTSWLTAIRHGPDLMGKLISIPLSLHSLNSEAHQTYVHCDRLPPTACACARQLPAALSCLRAAHCARACAHRTPEPDYYTTPELTARLVGRVEVGPSPFLRREFLSGIFSRNIFYSFLFEILRISRPCRPAYAKVQRFTKFVARILFLLFPNWSAWSCLGPAMLCFLQIVLRTPI